MKKKTKQLLLLVAVLVVLAAVYALMAFLPKNGEKPEDGTDGEGGGQEWKTVADFPAEEIAAYHYVTADYEIGFLINGDEYVNDAEPAFPVNELVVSSQLTAITALAYVQEIESTELKEYGLDTPRVALTVTLKDGTKVKYSLGDSALFDAGYYLLDEAKNRICLVDDSLYTGFCIARAALLKQEDMVAAGTDQIVRVTVESAEFPQIQLYYEDGQDNPWKLVAEDVADTEAGNTGAAGAEAGAADAVASGNAGEGNSEGMGAETGAAGAAGAEMGAAGTADVETGAARTADTEAVLAKLENYGNYVFRFAYEYDCRDFSAYGLDAPSTTVTVVYREKDADGNLTDKEAVLLFEFGAQTEDGLYYVRRNGSPYVYGMSSSYVKRIAEYKLSELAAEQ